jgi:gamma-glutamyltranspeptidase / glutathione hydrolase
VLRDGTTNSGATEPFHAWSEAVAECKSGSGHG